MKTYGNVLTLYLTSLKNTKLQSFSQRLVFQTVASCLASILPVCAVLAFTFLGPQYYIFHPCLQRNIQLALKHPERVHSFSLLVFALSWSTNTFTKTFQATQSPPPPSTFFPFPEGGWALEEGRRVIETKQRVFVVILER